MLKTRVAVLRGGPSEAYELSLATGASVLRLMPEQFDAADIFIDKNGTWHENGFPVEPGKILEKSDAVWNALHGAYGEGGEVQKLIQPYGIAYTGPGPLAAAISSNPILRARAYETNGIRHLLMKKIALDQVQAQNDALAHEIFRTFPFPLSLSVPSIGGRPLQIADFSSLAEALQAAAQDSDHAFIQESVSGKRAGVAVIDNFRGKKHYALLPFEISREEDRHPGIFNAKEKAALEEAAVKAHQALGMRHYSKSIFVVHPGRGPLLVETKSLPPIYEGSRLEQSLHAVGASVPQFLEHVLSEALAA